MNITGMQSHNNCDNAMYLAALMLSAIWVCRLESHMIIHPTYIIAYPIHNVLVLKSLGAVGLCQFKLKSESA